MIRSKKGCVFSSFFSGLLIRFPVEKNQRGLAFHVRIPIHISYTPIPIGIYLPYYFLVKRKREEKKCCHSFPLSRRLRLGIPSVISVYNISLFHLFGLCCCQMLNRHVSSWGCGPVPFSFNDPNSMDFFFSSGCPEPPKNKQKTSRMKNKYWEWRRRGRVLWVTGEDVDETPEKTESEKRSRKKDEGLWFSLEEFRRLGSLAEKFIYEKKLNFLFWHGVWMCDVYTHMDLCPALCVAYWSIHKYISASWLFYYVPSPDPWTISSTDSFTSFWIPSTFFLSFSYYLCVRYIIFAMARLVAAAVSICATPFLFRLPHSSPSLFFHFVIFVLIQKGSETDDLLLCYDDHTKEQKKKKRWRRGGPAPVYGWRLLSIYGIGAGVFFMSTIHFCKSFPSSGAHSSSSGRGAEVPQVFVASSLQFGRKTQQNFSQKLWFFFSLHL
jgi:hypothetical protein